MSNEQKAANRLAAFSLAVALIVQSLVGAYFYGRLSERVDNLQRDTQTLLNLQLQQRGGK